MGGEFTVINKYIVEDLQQANLWDAQMYQQLKSHDGSVQQISEIPISLREKYKEVFEIPALWIIKHAAARQKWIDQAQSTNIFYRGTSGKEVADIYQAAWEYGLKTTYYLRTLGASQVEKSTVTERSHKRKFEKSEESKSPTSPGKNEAAVMCSILTGPDCEACQ